MELREIWQSEFRADVHRKMWDGAAADYANKPIPRAEENTFVRRVLAALTPDCSVLDIGCGAGVYTLALAPSVRRAVGCDLSANMIASAKRRGTELGYSNAEFLQLDWHAADLEELGWENQFDVVFAHHTPAVSDYETFDKLVRCGKQAGFFCLNTRRQDRILHQALELVGIRPSNTGKDRSVPCAFAYLWQRGLNPQVECHDEVWTAEKPLEKQLEWVLSRASMQQTLSASQERTIAEYLASVAVDGTVTEHITTTVVTIEWRK